jgi:hypothetical protein
MSCTTSITKDIVKLYWDCLDMTIVNVKKVNLLVCALSIFLYHEGFQIICCKVFLIMIYIHEAFFDSMLDFYHTLTEYAL